jgi:NAD(P)H-dependent flavin oxidoreductase YrpB (nitropropane dioxygenase family)
MADVLDRLARCPVVVAPMAGGTSTTGLVLAASAAGALVARPPAVVSMLDHPGAPAGYPELHFATRPLRADGAASGDTGRMNLWAGEGYRAATTRRAAEVVALLSGGTGQTK